MRKIDRHIIRGFLLPFLLLTVVAVGLMLTMNFVEDITDYLSAAGTMAQALKRMGWVYALRAPSLLVPLVPMTILIAGAFTINHLERYNELVALKASGISVYRVLAPVFLTATLVSLAAAAVQEFVVPPVEAQLLPMQQRWVGRSERYNKVGGILEDEGVVYDATYNVATQKLRQVTLTFYGREELVVAESGTYMNDYWLLENVKRDQRGQKAEAVPAWEWRTHLRPEDLQVGQLDASAWSLGMLAGMIRREPDNASYRVMLYSRLTYPVQGLVLLFIAVPVLLSRESVRKSRLFGAGVAILLGAAYYAVTFLCNDLGSNGNLPPLVAGWLPVLMFGGIGLYLFDRVPT